MTFLIVMLASWVVIISLVAVSRYEDRRIARRSKDDEAQRIYDEMMTKMLTRRYSRSYNRKY